MLTSLPLEALLADVGDGSAPWCILLHGAPPAALAAAAAPEDAHHRLAAIGVVDAVLQRAAEALQVTEASRPPQLAPGLVSCNSQLTESTLLLYLAGCGLKLLYKKSANDKTVAVVKVVVRELCQYELKMRYERMWHRQGHPPWVVTSAQWQEKVLADDSTSGTAGRQHAEEL